MKLKFGIVTVLLLSTAFMSAKIGSTLSADRNLFLKNNTKDMIYVAIADATTRNILDGLPTSESEPNTIEATTPPSSFNSKKQKNDKNVIAAFQWVTVPGNTSEAISVQLGKPIQIAVWRTFPNKVDINYEKKLYANYVDPVINPAFSPGPNGYIYIKPISEERIISFAWNGKKLVLDNSWKDYFANRAKFDLNITKDDFKDLSGKVLGNVGP